MERGKYQEMLLKRIESTFTIWESREEIPEKELYSFLHKLKGTSGTIGLEALSDFCASQLDILSDENDGVIPMYSLVNFKNRIRQYLECNEKRCLTIPTVDGKKFDEGAFVLIIDDDLEFVSYVKDFLENMGAQVAIALNGKRGLEMFYSMRPNFILLDLYLPDMSGLEVLDQIANIARARHVPIAITSSDDSRENRINAYEHGAMDFLRKPLDADVFIAYLVNREEMRHMIDESIITDGLTGVGNRRHFDEMVSYFAEVWKRTGADFSLIMFDLDHFKKINDKYGHPAGDAVLRKLGELLNEMKRETDYVFRYGGEEFALIVTGAKAEEAIRLIERIRTKFNAFVFKEGDTSFSVKFSAGVASFEGDVQKLISSADQALYSAKRTGRNKTVIYHSDSAALKRKLHIIIVDDDKLIRTMLYEKLLQWQSIEIDINIRTFADGPSFLKEDWYRPEENFIILLDGIMPEMDGLEVLGRLKNEYNESNVIVAMMTARTSESDIKAALWLGADDYIMKPFKPADALARIQQLANRLFNK